MKLGNHLQSIVISAMLCCFIAAAAVVVLGHARAQESSASEVVCTTAHLSVVVDAVGDGQFNTHTVIPFGMCPGHFDLSPGEALTLLEAPLILYHGYEQFLKGIDSGSRDNKVLVEVSGNWMIPGVHLAGVREVTGILSGLSPEYTDEFTARSRGYIAAVTATGDSLASQFSVFHDVPVISAEMNRDFVEWTGLDVLADYPRDEDISIATMRDLIDKGREKGVRFVIDNMQSSGKVGGTIADNLGVPLIILTNFPDTNSDAVYPYLEALKYNCSLLIDALHAAGHSTAGGAS